MPRAYYSTVFPQPAAAIWEIIRDFNNYPVWVRGEPSLPVEDFQATLRITPVVDGDRSFVEWWADFDREPARRDELTGTLRGWFAQWLESLRGELDGCRVPRETASVNE
jgi:hypothetical protein